MKKRNVLLAVALSLVVVGTARSQIKTECDTDMFGHTTCTTNTPPPPQPSPADQLGKMLDEAKARRQAAAVAQQNAEAICVAGGGTFYKGQCLTQQQYNENRKAEADWAARQQAEREQVRIAKFAAEDARDAKKDAEKKAKEARKAAEKEAKETKKSGKTQPAVGQQSTTSDIEL